MVSFCPPPLLNELNVRVVVRWQGATASHAEIAALRQLLPELRDRPAADVFREARSAAEWVLATCDPGYARRLREQAERAGLVAVIEPAPVPVLRAVSDDEVVAELTAGGRTVGDFFLIEGLVCAVNGRDELMARLIDDESLSAATTAYLRRVGAREYGSYQEFVAGRP